MTDGCIGRFMSLFHVKQFASLHLRTKNKGGQKWTSGMQFSGLDFTQNDLIRFRLNGQKWTFGMPASCLNRVDGSCKHGGSW